MDQLEALEYLKKHSVYTDEWTGAGMWEAVEKVLDKKGWSVAELNALLEKAENF